MPLGHGRGPIQPAAFYNQPRNLPRYEFVCGAECVFATHWGGANIVSGVVSSTAQAHNGVNAILVPAAGAAMYCDRLVVAPGKFKVRQFSILFTSLPVANAELWTLRTNATTNDAIFGFDLASSKLAVWEQNGIASKVLGPVITTSTWYTIDLSIDSNSATSPTIKWQVDGAAQTTFVGTGTNDVYDFADYYGQTAASGHPAGTTFTAYYDDIVQSDHAADYPIPTGQAAIATPEFWLVRNASNIVATLTESVTSSDAWTRLGLPFARTDTESVQSADVWTRPSTFIRSTAESIQSSDAWVRSAGFKRTLTESVQSSDAWTRTATFVRTLTESVQSADVWTRSGGFIRTLSESVQSADVWVGTKLLLRTLTESVQSSDAWTRSGGFIRSTAESVASSDAWTRTATFLRTLTESVQSADAWVRSGGFKRTLTESIASADVWTAIKIVLRSMTESVQSSDAWTRSGSFARSLTESVQSADVWTRAVTFARSMAESVTSSDAWTRTAMFRRTLTEAVASSDAWTAIKGAPGVIGGIVRGFASAFHAIPGGGASHVRPDGGANRATPTGGANHPTPSGDADHEVPR